MVPGRLRLPVCRARPLAARSPEPPPAVCVRGLVRGEITATARERYSARHAPHCEKSALMVPKNPSDSGGRPFRCSL